MTITNILVCGAGMMGENFAFFFAGNERYRVLMYDRCVSDVSGEIRAYAKQFVEDGFLTEEDVEKRLGRIGFTTDIDSCGIRRADLVVEAMYDDPEMKRKTFARLEERCRPDTIFCTSSWDRSLSEISGELAHRDRFVGTHFRNPGQPVPLVEVVRSDGTSNETIQTVMNVLTASTAIAAMNLGGNC